MNLALSDDKQIIEENQSSTCLHESKQYGKRNTTAVGVATEIEINLEGISKSMHEA